MKYDAKFTARTASGDMLEVETSKQVAARVTTSEAKKFAQQMVSDHTKSNAERMALTTKKSIILPTTLSDDYAKALEGYSKEKGMKMDQEYMKKMLKEHKEDVKGFIETSVNASDPDIKAFAAKNVSVLPMRFDMATKMSPAVDVAK